MKNKIFIITLFSLIAIIMVSAPVTYALVSLDLIEYENMGNVIEPDRIYDIKILDAIENGKAALTDIYTNYLPLYAQIVSNAGTYKVNLEKPIYSLYSDISADYYKAQTVSKLDNTSELETTAVVIDDIEPTEPVEIDPGERVISGYKTSFLKSGLYSIDVEYNDGTTLGILTLVTTMNESQLRSRMETQVKEINRITAANTDVNVYVYVCSRFQDSEYFQDYVPGGQSLYPLVNDFMNSLDSRIKKDHFKVDSLEDYIDKLFMSDHHWNAYGMYDAYCDIINMISEDSPSIGNPRELGEKHVIENALFYGTNARTNNYYDAKFGDVFYFYDYNLPDHEIKTSNQYSGFKKNMENYLNGRFKSTIGTDHYVNFYPYAEYCKYPENKTGRNLLILGDSYSRGISELLSSNFDETYIYDYRRIHEIGNYNKFIADHGITDVLFMQYSIRGVYDYQNDNTLQTIKTD